jgi:hypothetical protein
LAAIWAAFCIFLTAASACVVRDKVLFAAIEPGEVSIAPAPTPPDAAPGVAPDADDDDVPPMRKMLPASTVKLAARKRRRPAIRIEKMDMKLGRI